MEERLRSRGNLEGVALYLDESPLGLLKIAAQVGPPEVGHHPRSLWIAIELV